MHMIVGFLDRVSRVLAMAAGAALLVIMGSLCLDVGLRKALDHGIPQAVEYSEVLLVIMVFLAWSETQRRGGHVAIELLVRRLPAQARQLIEIAGLILVFVIMMPIVWRTGLDAWHSYQQGEFRIGVAHTLMWPARAAVTLGLVALVGQLLGQIITSIDRARHHEALDQPGEHLPTPSAVPPA